MSQLTAHLRVVAPEELRTAASGAEVRLEAVDEIYDVLSPRF